MKIILDNGEEIDLGAYSAEVNPQAEKIAIFLYTEIKGDTARRVIEKLAAMSSSMRKLMAKVSKDYDS
jgi:hypothetical protein